MLPSSFAPLEPRPLSRPVNLWKPEVSDRRPAPIAASDGPQQLCHVPPALRMGLGRGTRNAFVSFYCRPKNLPARILCVLSMWCARRGQVFYHAEADIYHEFQKAFLRASWCSAASFRPWKRKQRARLADPNHVDAFFQGPSRCSVFPRVSLMQRMPETTS